MQINLSEYLSCFTTATIMEFVSLLVCMYKYWYVFFFLLFHHSIKHPNLIKILSLLKLCGTHNVPVLPYFLADSLVPQ